MLICGNKFSGITIDYSGKFRYVLYRVWDETKETILWFLLNPSTADESVLDPTLTRCRTFSMMWGYGGFRVINVFAYRATKPKDLRRFKEEYIIGGENNATISKECLITSKIIVGWGNNICRYKSRLEELDELLCPFELYSLGVTKTGQPSHPLYLRGDCKPLLYKKINQSLFEVKHV